MSGLDITGFNQNVITYRPVPIAHASEDALTPGQYSADLTAAGPMLIRVGFGGAAGDIGISGLYVPAGGKPESFYTELPFIFGDTAITVNGQAADILRINKARLLGGINGTAPVEIRLTAGDKIMDVIRGGHVETQMAAFAVEPGKSLTVYGFSGGITAISTVAVNLQLSMFTRKRDMSLASFGPWFPFGPVMSLALGCTDAYRKLTPVPRSLGEGWEIFLGMQVDGVVQNPGAVGVSIHADYRDV